MSAIQNKINGNGLYYLSQVIGKTGRYQVEGMNNLAEAQATDKPIILVTWHGMTMMMVGFFSGFYDISSVVLLMPDDWRGGALSIFATRLGAHPFPMNLSGDSSMATARKLAQLIRRVKGGSNCYITPDGPDGPAYAIKPGVAYIAQKANAVILPMGAYTRHGYRLNRWDRYVVPYPFSRISVVVGSPIHVPKKVVDLATITEPLTDALHRVAAQAAANYYEKKG